MRSTGPARRMSARSVARLTDTLSTPSIRARAASTRPTQLAQVMPSMGRLMDAAARTSLVFDVLMVRSHWLYSTWRQASVLSLKFVQELASDFWRRQGAATSHSGAMARSCNAARRQKVPAEWNSQLLIQDTRPCHRGKVKYCAFFNGERAGLSRYVFQQTR